MNPFWQTDNITLYCGHVLDVLQALQAESVHSIITSPPYWALRDYALPPVEWTAVSYVPIVGLPEINVPAWRGSFGLEPIPEMFIGHLVLIWRELHRVLRADGTCWLNLGDTYSQDTKWGGKSSHKNAHSCAGGYATARNLRTQTRLKSKNLCAIPWRVALALQADGWYLRSAPPWIKPNCQPESVTDRATTAHEYWFQFSKSKRYYWDPTAVRVQSGNGWHGGTFTNERKQQTQPGLGHGPRNERPGRNRRTSDTWNESLDARIADYRAYLAHLEHIRDHGGLLLDEVGDPLGLMFSTRGYKGTHFATFNGALIEPMIKASTSGRGCCPQCGAPWERVTDREFIPQPDVSVAKGIKGNSSQKPMDQSSNWDGFPRGTVAITTIGFRPTCACYDHLYRALPQAHSPRKRHQRQISGNWWKRARRHPGLSDWPVEPCIVLDPFAGAGTTGLECIRLGRRVVLIDLSEEYCRDHIVPRLSAPIQPILF